MWAHTRGVQLAFFGRSQDSLARRGLDATPCAVFEDMTRNGTRHSQLPIFEQRPSAHCTEYHAAAACSGSRLGEGVMRHLGSQGCNEGKRLARAVSQRAIAVANPLRDFLKVDLVD